MTAMEKAKPTRPDMRGAMTNEEDPRARAARRAAEVRGHIGTMDDGTDIFAIPPTPAGWSYEWKRKSVLGQEDPAHQVALRRMGWDPVPSARHPEMMPSDNISNTIERKGMILMERPTELVEEARMIELQRARQQVNHKEAQLAGVPEGGLGNRDHPQVKPRIGKSYEAMPIPKE